MRRTHFDIAYATIRQRILGGQFAPGQTLPAERLAAEAGFSRTPVRDALRRLAAEGLVTLERRLGASVRRMEPGEFEELCDLRLALEGHAAALAAVNRTGAELQGLRAALRVMRPSGRPGPEEDEARAVARAELAFHQLLFAAARNEWMLREILRHRLVFRVVAGPGRDRSAAAAEAAAGRRALRAASQRVYAAIEQRDGAAARQAMARALEATMAAPRQQLRRRAAAELGRQTRAELPLWLA